MPRIKPIEHDDRLSIVEHLDELRSRLVICAFIFGAAFAVPVPGTSRVAVPVYKGRRQVGRATSTTWSTVLKKLIALATIDAPHYAFGSRVDMEITVEAVRHRAAATVVPTPFFKPPRKTS